MKLPNMKLVLLLLIVPFVLAGPSKPSRRLIPEENDPNFKRYIYVDNNKGQIEMIDLRDAGDGRANRTVLQSDVEYDLYTPSNPITPNTIRNNTVSYLANTHFDPTRKTIFLVHGLNNDRHSDVNKFIREALFGSHNVNLFVVDWSEPASGLYLGAQGSVVSVGQIIGSFVILIQSTYNLTGDDFIFLGHSLGAHVVGNAGAIIGSKISNIIGMDPAGPLFTVGNIANRLDQTDGKFVQVIHTNGRVLGFGSSLGHIDFYPQGGMSQPGCDMDLTGVCSHSKAYKYVAEAITRGASVFRATLCTDWDRFMDGECEGNIEAFMADFEPQGYANGDFYLAVNPDSPFGLSSALSYQCSNWFLLTVHVPFLYILRFMSSEFEF